MSAFGVSLLGGGESKVLVLDEVSFLDEAGQAALIDVLLGLRDAPLDSILSVTKEDGRSRVEVAA